MKIIVTLFHINQGNINLYIITPVPLSAGNGGRLDYNTSTAECGNGGRLDG